MRYLNRIGCSLIALAMGAIGSSCSLAGDFVQPQPAPSIITPEGTELYYHGRSDLRSMYYPNRLSFADYQKDIKAQAEASRNLEIERRTHPWRYHLRAFHVGQSHQTINTTAQNNREYVTQWFCYIKGNGMAVWDHRP